MDLDLQTQDDACNYYMLKAFGLEDSPKSIWRELPPRLYFPGFLIIQES
jgi:hypothetical protein